MVEEEIQDPADGVDNDHEIVAPAPAGGSVENKCFGDCWTKTGDRDGPEIKPRLLRMFSHLSHLGGNT